MGRKRGGQLLLRRAATRGKEEGVRGERFLCGEREREREIHRNSALFLRVRVRACGHLGIYARQCVSDCMHVVNASEYARTIAYIHTFACGQISESSSLITALPLLLWLRFTSICIRALLRFHSRSRLASKQRLTTRMLVSTYACLTCPSQRE